MLEKKKAAQWQSEFYGRILPRPNLCHTDRQTDRQTHTHTPTHTHTHTQSAVD